MESPIIIISITKTITKESKQMKTETFVIVLALKRAVLNGSTKSCFKIFLEFFVRQRINGLSIKVNRVCVVSK